MDFIDIEFSKKSLAAKYRMDGTQIEAHIKRTPPACIRGFQLASTELSQPFDNNLKTVWLLSCKCGCSTGRLLGYPLREQKLDYKGGIFVSPLAFECAGCGGVTEIIDTDVHGYHAEVAKMEGGVGSSKIRGTGARKAFGCPDCGKVQFAMTVGFIYWDIDIMLDEPDLPGEDFFNVFLMECKCVSCVRVSQPTEFGKM